MIRSFILFIFFIHSLSPGLTYANSIYSYSASDSLKPSWIDIFSYFDLLSKYPLQVDTVGIPDSYSMDNIDSFYDANNQLISIQTLPMIWFEHSPPTFKKYIKDKPFVFCEVSFQQLVKGEKNLYFSLHVYEKNRVEKFGEISSTSPLLIHTLNSEPIILPIQRSRVNQKALKGYVTFEMVCLVKRSEIQVLRQAELDKVQISFTKGDLSFEIFNVDFFDAFFKSIPIWK